MASYPREIYLDADTEERLRSYLNEELLNHYSERSEFQDSLVRYAKDYWAKPTTEKATFPFTNAATIVIPLTAIAVEAVHARTMTTLFGLSQFTSIKPISPAFADVARPMERMLDHELMKSIKIYNPINSIVLEIEKFGTGIGKVGYEKIIKTAVREGPTGEEEEFKVVTKQGAVVDAVPLSRFLMPYGDQDPQQAAWCGEEHSKSPFEIKSLQDSGMFRSDVMEKLEGWVASTSVTGDLFSERKFERAQEALEKRTAVWPKRIDWVELWFGWDVDGSGDAREIVVHYHRPSSTFMSIRYNWYADLHRPYRTGVYFPVEHRWMGIGICKQNEQFQREITTQHRQRLDNATLANCKMLKINKLSGYGPKEPVFPGKMWFVDNKDDIESFDLGEIYQSSFANEQSSLLYAQQRSGVNELTLGMPSAGTPGTATGDLARVQEGNKRWDFTYRNIKNLVSDIVLDVACNIQQFGPKNITYFDLADGGALVKQMLTLPPDLIRDGILLDISVAGQTENKLLDRQNWQNVAAMIQQYYSGMIGLAQSLGDPNMLAILSQKAMIAATEAMKQILESYDIRSVDRIVVTELLQYGIKQQVVQGGDGGLAIPSQPNGMGNNSAPSI